jgi:hypothetical protein
MSEFISRDKLKIMQRPKSVYNYPHSALTNLLFPALFFCGMIGYIYFV